MAAGGRFVMKLVGVVCVLVGACADLHHSDPEGQGRRPQRRLRRRRRSGLLGTKTGDFLTWVTIGLVGVFLILGVIMVKYYRPRSRSAENHATDRSTADPDAIRPATHQHRPRRPNRPAPAPADAPAEQPHRPPKAAPLNPPTNRRCRKAHEHYDQQYDRVWGSTAEDEGIVYTVEIRAVNNRYFKPHMRLPDIAAYLEADIEKLLRERIHRGDGAIIRCA